MREVSCEFLLSVLHVIAVSVAKGAKEERLLQPFEQDPGGGVDGHGEDGKVSQGFHLQVSSRIRSALRPGIRL